MSECRNPWRAGPNEHEFVVTVDFTVQAATAKTAEYRLSNTLLLPAMMMPDCLSLKIVKTEPAR